MAEFLNSLRIAVELKATDGGSLMLPPGRHTAADKFAWNLPRGVRRTDIANSVDEPATEPATEIVAEKAVAPEIAISRYEKPAKLSK